MWWLGENSNAAALEYAGDSEAVKATAAVNAAMQKRCSPGEIIAVQVCAEAYVMVLACGLYRKGNMGRCGGKGVHKKGR